MKTRNPRKHNPKIGQKFGLLTVLAKEPITQEQPRTRYLCLCDCGNKVTREAYLLYRRKNGSCGCSKFERGRQMGKARLLMNGDPTENNIIAAYKAEARRRGYIFELSKEECQQLFKGNCYYCGIKPTRKVKHREASPYFIYNGIDRKDNRLGYNFTNCVSCCTTCNTAKNIMTIQEFKIWAERLTNHLSQIHTA